ncbi:hypothetical protein SAMN05660337_0375 [Maridesulfovibrio ferrireducens]|uniref:Uncharacterized protein n=1 Tax=Maridesulfovibrio ferrireducens TaxID=246191 RepID=A0A1G9BPQ9_9BACT|nr:hypothetical protein [Maridesulfovibrio ferrireducens]SDK41437.1 hypothetical protein SAMN05660337_0375 [Maridesulfovibrio ferrireducens]
MIKNIICALTLLLVFNEFCFAGADVFISCEDIEGIDIVQIMREPPFVDSSVKQYIYAVEFSLKPEAGARFSAIREATKPDKVDVNGTIYDIVRASLHTKDGVVTSDYIEGSLFNEKSISISKLAKKAALEVVDNACSKIKPRTYYTYDVFDALGIDMKTGQECKGELVSCEEYEKILSRCSKRLAEGRNCDDFKTNCKPSEVTKNGRLRISP